MVGWWQGTHFSTKNILSKSFLFFPLWDLLKSRENMEPALGHVCCESCSAALSEEGTERAVTKGPTPHRLRVSALQPLWGTLCPERPLSALALASLVQEIGRAQGREPRTVPPAYMNFLDLRL